MLKYVKWNHLGAHILTDVPQSIRREINGKYSNDTQRKQAMLEEWWSHHPAPSWMLVANALYMGYVDGKWGHYHEQLQLVKEKYLKGRKRFFLHVSHSVLEICPLHGDC